MMRKYKDWSPTPFDSKGLGSHVPGEWYVFPVLVTRDTEEHSREASNYDVAMKEFERIDPEWEQHQEHSFNHWGPGWFSIVLVKPGSACNDAAEEMIRALEDYPVLDDGDLSEREYKAVCEYWDRASTRDRIEWLQRYGGSVFAARRDSPWNIETEAGDWPSCLLY